MSDPIDSCFCALLVSLGALILWTAICCDNILVSLTLVCVYLVAVLVLALFE
jgi:hypothetical protein